MSSIQLSGLSTGIDTEALISQLMEVERRTLNLYTQRKETYEEKKDALSDLQGKLSSLQSTVKQLSDESELRAYNVTSSDEDKITAEATYNAFEGNHSVEVNQLAASERWVHTAGFEYMEDYVGAGTFIYSYNHQEMVITTTADTTLEDLVGLINNDAENPGVTAGLLYYNDAYHLVLSGNDAGTDYEISINASSTEVWQADSELTSGGENATLSSEIIDLDQFGANPLESGEVIEITGTDHGGVAITQVDLNLTEHTRIEHLIGEINDAFDGIATATFENGKIILTDDTCGASDLSINLTYNANGSSATLTLPTMAVSTEGGDTTADLAGFAEADFTETQQAQDSQIKVDGFPPGAEEWITRSSNTIDDVISGVTLHLHDTTDGSTEEINLTRDVSSVKEKIQSFAEAYNEVVAYIKETTGYDATVDEAGVLIGDYVVSVMKQQLSNPLYSQRSGFVEDVDTFLAPGQIGLELDSDGLLTLDSTVFDEAIAEDYLGVLAMIGADKSGSTDSADIRFYGASSTYTTADSYRVKVVYDGSGNLSEAYFRLSSEGDSAYRSATVDGNVIIGESSFTEDGNPVNPENGLQLTAPTTGTPGSTVYATVRVKQGFAGAIEDSLADMLHATRGSLSIDTEHIDDQIELLQDKIDLEEQRLEVREERLVRRFASLESTLTILQSQLSYLQSSF